jgi:hypothetical protein
MHRQPHRRTGFTGARRALCAGMAAVMAATSGGLAHGADPAPPTEPSQRDRADALVREAASRGKANDWDGAIAAFREAEALYPRAIHDCNIGLAFMRSARPHMAWVYLGRCQVRATDALPPWVDTMRRDALTAMRDGAWAPIEVTATPHTATVSVDALPQEVFTPTAGTLSLWLPHGQHTLRVTAPNHVAETRLVTVAGRDPTRISVALSPAPVTRPEPVARPETPPPEPVEPPRVEAPEVSSAGAVSQRAPVAPQREISTTSWAVLAGGLGIVAGGLVALGFAIDSSGAAQRDRIEAGPRFDALRQDFKVQNTVWIAMGLTGGIVTAAGATMMGFDLWGDRAGSSGELTLSPSPQGGSISLRGRF